LEKHVINGKSIYVFEQHNVAFAAWCEIKREHDEDLNLITLDHHTDTKLGFGRSTHVPKLEEHLPIIVARAAQVDFRNDEDVKKAVEDLWNDEQIDAAILVGLFKYAFCFNNCHTNTKSIEQEAYMAKPFFWFNENPPQPPFTYKRPERGFYEIGEICAVGCEAKRHGDDCNRLQADQVIESAMLNQLLIRANAMATTLGIQRITDVPFVLDIDLDYFRTIKSLAPTDATTFYSLVRNAVALTIATEPDYVHDLRLDEELTSEAALTQMMSHMNRALE
jgi:hypothetical protein